MNPYSTFITFHEKFKFDSTKTKQNFTANTLPIITPEDPDLDILGSVKDNGLG